MEVIHYEIICHLCDSVTRVAVYENEEEPLHCPMCGTEVEADYVGDSDT